MNLTEYFEDNACAYVICIIIAIVVLLFFAVSVAFDIYTKHISGNKQFIDFNHQNFNVAYIKADDSKWERIQIKAWNDYPESDTIQVLKMDGKAIYTHSCNVKLCAE